MIRINTVLLAFAFATAVHAQVPLTVHDAGSKEAVPYAHVTWHALNTLAKGVEVAGPDGKLALPVDQAAMKAGVAIRIDFVGYRPITDTLHTLTARTFGLQHAQLFDGAWREVLRLVHNQVLVRNRASTNVRERLDVEHPLIDQFLSSTGRFFIRAH